MKGIWKQKNRPWFAVMVLVVVAAFLALPLQGVFALETPSPVDVTLTVQGINAQIFNGTGTVTPVNDQAPTVLDALKQILDDAGITYTTVDSAWGPYIYEIGGDAGGTFGGWDGWLYSVNDTSPWVGAHEYEIAEGGSIVFTYNRWPVISLATDPYLGDSNPQVQVTLVGDEFTAGAEDAANWDTSPGTTGLILTASQKTTPQTVTLSFSGTAAKGTLEIQAKSGALGGPGDSNGVSILVGVNRGPLQDAVDTAAALLAAAGIGDGVGQYPAGAVSALQAALAAAKTVLEAEEASQEEINEAADGLSGAITRFRSAEIVEEASDLQKSIAAAAAYYSQTKTLTSWWELVALRGAGVDLSKGGWQLPAWNSQSLPADAAATTYAGFILGLMARGEDPEKAWGSRNLLRELADKQLEDGSFGDGANSTIWGIVALKAAEHPFAHDKAVAYLLGHQLQDGGYTFFGDTGDPDLTGMALVALSPYKGLTGVKTAIERALAFLEGIQLPSGGFASWGNENANTNATVLTGLVAAGENIFSSRWVKNPSLYDALAAFQLENGSFSFLIDPLEANAMATSQALLALGDLQAGTPAFFRLQDLPRTGGRGTWGYLTAFLGLGTALLVKGRKR